MIFSRNIMVSILAAGIALSGAPIANAQSSNVFGSSSSSLIGDNQAHSDSKSARLKEIAERADTRAGHIKNAEAERKAEALLARALNGELAYYQNVYERETYAPLTQSTVVRIPKADIDTVIELLNNYEVETTLAAPFGVAAGVDENYYYLAEVFIVR